eukprot:CAMPEP_0117857334 /NCGR_PEP_ID=MMETSP0950-20121206/1823_1 /TAXON_ID=44440 /ORGANISM="Chattonella subsalsa, Strain CCMP2191" /LENGTH=448 /DNA_ID=CAMNT_0005706691 /DNA_START=8 /DNA_END=1351 /DNA_ORIENTATION=-
MVEHLRFVSILPEEDQIPVRPQEKKGTRFLRFPSPTRQILQPSFTNNIPNKRSSPLCRRKIQKAQLLESDIIIDPQPPLDFRLSEGAQHHDLILKEDLSCLSVLGCGTFGEVYLARHNFTHQLYAVKVIEKKSCKSKKSKARLRTEKCVLEECKDCQFINHFYCTFQTASKYMFCLEYCSGGEIFHHLLRRKKFSQEHARVYIAELVVALLHMHSKNILYRDLKPENVLLSQDGHIRLVDFGLAKMDVSCPFSGAGTYCGTPEYLAPEVILRQGYGLAVDWWQLGMFLYELLTGWPPWYSQEREEVMNSILTETLILPDSMSTDTQMFLNNLLDRDPTARLGSHNEADITGHEFFNDLDWDAANQGRLKPPFDPCGTKSLHTAPNVDISVKTKLSTNLRMHEVFEEPSIENSEVEFDGNSFVEGSLKEFSEPSFNEEPLTSSFRKRFW